MASKRPLFVAIIFGIIAVILVYAYMRSMEKQLTQKEMEYGTVVVAVDKIPVRTKIKEGMVQEREWPVDHIPKTAYMELDEVLGLITAENLYADSPVFPDQFKEVGEVPELAPQLKDAERAVTLGVTEITAVGGNVKVGDHVDVIASFKGNDEVGAPTTITMLRDVRVVAVGTDIGTDLEESGGAGISKSITLAVSPEEAEILTLVDENASIRLSLRPLDERYAPPSPGLTLSDVIRYRPTREEVEAEAKAAEEERMKREEEMRRAWEAQAWASKQEAPVADTGPKLPQFPAIFDAGPKEVQVEVIKGGEIETVTVPESLYNSRGYSVLPSVRYRVGPGMYPVPYFEE